MHQRDRYIPGVPCWADTNQQDPEAAVAFYGELFGWDLEQVMPPQSPVKYYIARLRGGDVAAIGSAPERGDSPAWNTYIWVQDADATAARIQAAGGRLIDGVYDVMGAGRTAVCSDPEGAVFRLWQAGDHRGARIVNEPGSVNFNGLHTGDPEGARSFYGSVFGWEALPMGGGAQGWRLPGYGDFLEERDPGLRERLAEMGAPAGFEDVVATLTPLGDDQAYMPAQWSVTFAVEDADAVAAAAAQRGGHVVTPPFDGPWVRMTVIRDPGGATFTASRFSPENRNLEA